MQNDILTLSYSPQMLVYFSLDILIAFGLLLLMRWVYSLWTNVDGTVELAGKDNFAFGVSVAASLLGLSIVVWSAAEQASSDSYLTQSLQMLAYGITGIILIKVGRWAHDKVILNRFNKRQQILEGNVSIGLVDAANTIATAVIIRSVMLWTQDFTLYSGIAILSGFIVAQTVMLVTTRLMERRFAKDNQNDSMQDVLVGGQVALAIQHGGHLLGVAFAVTAASKLLVYYPEAYISNLINWLFLALLFTLLTIVLAWMAKKLVLKGIDLVREVDQQHNIGVASIEMALIVGVALLLLGLVS